jgi:D-xylose transport system substrate-binding protein
MAEEQVKAAENKERPAVMPIVASPESEKHRPVGLIVAVVALACVVIGLSWLGYSRMSIPVAVPQSNAPAAAQPMIIGLSIADFRESRWLTERDIMTAEAAKLGATVISMTADGDAALQTAQAKNLMLQGAQVLIVVSQDGEKAAAIVDEAHQGGVKVIAYDRLIKNSDLDYYVTFDSVKVGMDEAQGVLDATGGKGRFVYIGGSPTDNNAALVRNGSFKVLQPKIDSGAVQIVLDQQIPDWNATTAYQVMKGFLDKGGKLDAAVVANDGMAGGVIQALKEHGLAGKVPVSGQDAELRACRDLLTGNQTITVYKPLKQLATEAIRMAVAAAGGQPVQTDLTTDNGKVKVPSRLLDVVAVTKQNLDSTVIKDGLYTQADVYGAKP